jgi:uncharacterized protein YdeI (YjbR/CyaY-like superfamily)
MSSSKSVPSQGDARVDAYIAKAAPFAQPILEHVRAAMHAACPELEEAIKWSHPFFLLDGRPFANMAAFKAHCGLGFWKGGRPVAEAAATPTDKAMGQFGRIEALADLPTAAALRKLIANAASEFRAANAAVAAAPPTPRRVPREAPVVPDDFAAALRSRRQAQAAFDGFTPSQQREYVEWIVEARRAATRESRIAQAVEWIGEGKTRNWKYAAC